MHKSKNAENLETVTHTHTHTQAYLNNRIKVNKKVSKNNNYV